MTSMHSRRTIVKGIASLGFASIGIATAPGLGAKTLFQTNGMESGGIGLSRTEWESTYGPGEATQSHGLYRDPAYGGPIYVGFDFVNSEDGLLDFLEIQWSDVSQGGGLSQEEAAAQISTLLPADAQLRESYFMGATPGGPTALRSQRWTSRAGYGDERPGIHPGDLSGEDGATPWQHRYGLHRHRRHDRGRAGVGWVVYLWQQMEVRKEATWA